MLELNNIEEKNIRDFEYETNWITLWFQTNKVAKVERLINTKKYELSNCKLYKQTLNNNLIQLFIVTSNNKICYTAAPNYYGYGYHGGGKKSTGINRKSITISGKPEEIEKLKENARKQNTELSELVLATMIVTMKYTDKEIVAMNKALEEVNIEPGFLNIKHYTDCEYITINKGRNDKEYVWYLDGDGYETCIEIENLKILEKEEIEKYLV